MIFVELAKAAAGLAAIFGVPVFVLVLGNASWTPISLPSGLHIYVDGWGQQYSRVTATGTWKAITADEQDQLAFPLQTSKITCFTGETYCTEATAQIAFGGLLDLDLRTLRITSWTDQRIVFEDDAKCAKETYFFDRSPPRVYGTTTPKHPCSVPIRDTIIDLQLVDGFKLSNELQQQARKRREPLFWSATIVWWLAVAIWFWKRKKAASIETAVASAIQPGRT